MLHKRENKSEMSSIDLKRNHVTRSIKNWLVIPPKNYNTDISSPEIGVNSFVEKKLLSFFILSIKCQQCEIKRIQKKK